MEYYQGKLCVTFGELTGGDEPIVTKWNLQKWLRRGQAVYARKAYGRGASALVSFSSLPKDAREKFVEKYGNPEEVCPDPAKSKDELKLRMDDRAHTYYKYEYTYTKGGSEVRLSETLVEEYTLNATVIQALIAKEKDLKLMRNKLCNSSGSLWGILLDYSEQLKAQYYHTLPSSVARLRKRVRDYQEGGYDTLVSGKVGNVNTVKITPEVGEILIGLKRNRMPRRNNQQILDHYNKVIAPQKGLPVIDSISTLRTYLYDPAVKAIWADAVLGEKEAHAKLGYKFNTTLPTLPNALWYGDGTRVNLYYWGRNKKGEKALCTTDVYMVMDAATEVFVGWRFGAESSEETQFPAFRDAIIFAGVRPYEIALDNQSGQKKLDRRGFFDRISVTGVHFVTAYRAQAKSIEAAFGRFQLQHLAQYPFFTGTNITSKGEEVKPDLDWLAANKDVIPHDLRELKQIFESCVEEWHNNQHPTMGVSRMEYYKSVSNPELPELTLQDKCDILWIDGAHTHTFDGTGLEVTINRKTYTYDVYDDDGHINHPWRQRNMRREFAIKYDPCDLSCIALYTIDKDGAKRFECFAQPAVTVARAAQDRTERDEALTYSNLLGDKRARMERIAQGRAIDLKMGATYNLPKVSGLSSEDNEWINARARQIVADGRQRLEVDFPHASGDPKGKRQGRLVPSYGEMTKAISRKDLYACDGDIEEIDNNIIARRCLAEKM